MDFGDIILLLLLVGVLGALVMGMVAMFRGKDARKSNQMMMWRVILQGAALVLAALILAKHS